MILKIKSLIYRAFGVYLASKEELEYLKSEEMANLLKKDINRQKRLKADDRMEIYDLIGLRVGLWQVKHGFGRFWIPYKGVLKKITLAKYSKNKIVRWPAKILLYFIETTYNIYMMIKHKA